MASFPTRTPFAGPSLFGSILPSHFKNVFLKEKKKNVFLKFVGKASVTELDNSISPDWLQN